MFASQLREHAQNLAVVSGYSAGGGAGAGDDEHELQSISHHQPEAVVDEEFPGLL